MGQQVDITCALTFESFLTKVAHVTPALPRHGLLFFFEVGVTVTSKVMFGGKSFSTSVAAVAVGFPTLGEYVQNVSG